MISKENPQRIRISILISIALLILVASPMSSVYGNEIKDDSSSFDPETSQEADDRIGPCPNSRSSTSDTGPTVHIEDLSDGSGIAYLNGTVLDRGCIVNDLEAPEQVHGITSKDLIPLCHVHPDRTLITNDSSIFLIYSISEGANINLMIKNSSNRGENWSEPILVWKGKCDIIRASLAIWNGSLFVFFSPHDQSNPSKNDLFVQHSPLDNIMELVNSDRVEIKSGLLSDFEAVSIGGSLCLFVSDTNQMRCTLYRFDGDDWSSGSEILQNGHCDSFSILTLENGTGTSLYIFYINGIEINRSSNDLTLMSRSSHDGGLSFTPSINITYIHENSSEVQAVAIDDRIAVLFNIPGEDRIHCSMSSDNGINWTNQIIELDHEGLNSSYGGIDRFVASYHGGRLFITFLTASSELYYSCSIDEENPLDLSMRPLDVNESVIDHPSISSIDDIVLYCRSDIDKHSISLKRIGAYMETGSLELNAVSSPILRCWEDVGINANIPNGSEVMIRIIDSENRSRSFPDEGWSNLSTFQGDRIHGEYYDHVIELNESWMGSDPPRSLSLSFVLTGSGSVTPMIDDVAINYSTSFPYDEDLSTLLHIRETDASFEPGYLNMTSGSNIQYFITEPLVKESGPWPDLLSFCIDGIGSGNDVYVGLMDPISGDPITGFSTMDCVLRYGFICEKMYIPFWNGSGLAELPEEVQAIEILVVMVSDHMTGNISVRGIKTLNDPRNGLIEGSMDHGTMIRRTEELQIEASLTEEVQSSQDLIVGLASSGPEGQLLPVSSIIGNGFHDDTWNWTVKIPVDCELGAWSFIVTISNMSSNFEISIFNIGTLMVINNVPSPPTIEFQIKEPGTLDDLLISVVDVGLDIETPTEELVYTYEWLVDGVPDMKIENTTSLISTIDHDLTAEDQIWSVLVSCNDGIDRSMVVDRTIKISNTGPRVLDGIPRTINILEDTSGRELDPTVLFEDPDEDQLYYNIIPGPFLNISIAGGKELLVPDPDWNGITEVVIEASDEVSTVNVTIAIEVGHVNDPPEDVKIITPENNTSGNISFKWNFSGRFTDRDEAYGQEISCYWDIDGKKVGEGPDISGIMILPGIHNISFIVTDEDGSSANDMIMINVFDNVSKDKEINDGNDTLDTDGNDTMDTDGNITDQEIDEDDPSGEVTAVFFVFIFGLIIIVVVGSLLIIRTNNENDRYKGFTAAPISDEKGSDEDEDLDSVSHNISCQLHLPSAEKQRNKKDGRMNFFRSDNWRKEKKVNTCITQNGQIIEDKRSLSDRGFYPYSFRRSNEIDRVEPLDDRKSFYIRPEFPYQGR